MELKVLQVLGVKANPLELHEFLEMIEERIGKREKTIVANHNLHSVYLFHKNVRMKRFYDRAFCVHVDGMPLIFWAKVLGYRVTRSQRLTFIDFVWPVLALLNAMNKKLFILGGREKNHEKTLELIKKRFPDLRVGFHHGYFDVSGAENEVIVKKINAFSADAIFVGMGMPRQELWILENFQKLDCPLFFNSGACFEYLSGSIFTPPRWAGKICLEWLFRLLTAPRRVYKRYLWEPWFLIPYFFRDLFAKRDRDERCF
jgi:N-acetylglucosaminyldiphosphoundecaprenol N-acetyl-beta-D-mannosaminyltransferase